MSKNTGTLAAGGVAGDLRLVNVTKRFGGFAAVNDLTLTIPQGSFFALLGASGCGKTTTLRMVSGLEEPTAGRVLIGDHDVTRLRPYKRPVNTVFQNYALFPHLTVADNIAFGLRQRGVKDVKKPVQDMLDLIELSHIGARKPTQLSGGQQQRIALARALVFEPDVLLLDEPLAALDKQLRDAMQLEVRRIHERTGMTTIAVTHDQVEAMTMSDRVVILDDGRVSQIGTPEEVYERPANLFVAGFLGEANLLAVRDGAVPALGVAAGGAKQGTAVVRPEHVALTDDPAGRPGTVTDASFQGTRMRLAVRLESGETIIVSAPVDAVADRPGRGDAVRVRSTRQTVHAVPETATAATTTAAAVEPAGSHP
jgi:spermidine/putrescine transport system ATP-binding protein